MRHWNWIFIHPMVIEISFIDGFIFFLLLLLRHFLFVRSMDNDCFISKLQIGSWHWLPHFNLDFFYFIKISFIACNNNFFYCTFLCAYRHNKMWVSYNDVIFSVKILIYSFLSFLLFIFFYFFLCLLHLDVYIFAHMHFNCILCVSISEVIFIVVFLLLLFEIR